MFRKIHFEKDFGTTHSQAFGLCVWKDTLINDSRTSHFQAFEICMFAKIHLNDSRINDFQAFVLHMLGKIQTLKNHWRTISTYTSTPPNSSRWTSLRYVSFAIQTESLARSYITVAEHAIDVSKWLAYCVVEACHSGVFFFLSFFFSYSFPRS